MSEGSKKLQVNGLYRASQYYRQWRQALEALGTGYQQARPIRIKRGIKEPDDPKNQDQSQVKDEKRPVKDITGVKKKKISKG